MSPRRGHIALVATAIGVGAVSVAVVSWQISTVRRRHRAVAAAEMLRRGRVAADNGDHEGADANFRSAIELGADPAEAWNLIGIALRARGRYEEALAAYDRAIVAGGETAVRLTNRANALRALGRMAEAERLYVRATELDLDYARAYCGLGRVAEAAGDFAGAADLYGKAVERGLSPARAAPWIYLALARSGRAERAVEALGPALDSKGFDRSVARFLSGRLSPNGLLSRAAPSDELRTRAHYYLGARFLLEDRPREALEQLRAAVAFHRCNSVEYGAARDEIRRLGKTD